MINFNKRRLKCRGNCLATGKQITLKPTLAVPTGNMIVRGETRVQREQMNSNVNKTRTSYITLWKVRGHLFDPTVYECMPLQVNSWHLVTTHHFDSALCRPRLHNTTLLFERDKTSAIHLTSKHVCNCLCISEFQQKTGSYTCKYEMFTHWNIYPIMYIIQSPVCEHSIHMPLTHGLH